MYKLVEALELGDVDAVTIVIQDVLEDVLLNQALLI